MKLKDKIENYLKTMKTHTFGDVKLQFPGENINSLEGIYYRYKNKDKLRRSKKLRAKLVEVNFDESKKLKLDDIEPLIANALNKGFNIPVVRLALDLIKLKQVDKGIDDEIDISKYIKKAQEVLEAID